MVDASVLSIVAQIAIIFISISMALYTLLPLEGDREQYFETKSFIKYKFTESALILVAAPLLLYWLFVSGIINGFYNKCFPNCIIFFVDLETFTLIILSFIFVVLLILIITRIINWSYYTLLQNESSPEFEKIISLGISGALTPFKINGYNISGTMFRLYNKIPENYKTYTNFHDFPKISDDMMNLIYANIDLNI